MRRSTRRLGLVIVVLAVVVAVLLALGLQQRASARPVTITVVTRNVYLGADIMRPFRATEGQTGPVALRALAHGGRSGTITALSGEVVGNELTDRDPATGLWPSDHAGVVFRLKVG